NLALLPEQVFASFFHLSLSISRKVLNRRSWRVQDFASFVKHVLPERRECLETLQDFSVGTYLYSSYFNSNGFRCWALLRRKCRGIRGHISGQRCPLGGVHFRPPAGLAD